MGKESLIKSTAKKSGTGKKKESAKKTTKKAAANQSAPKTPRKQTVKAETAAPSSPAKTAATHAQAKASAADPAPKPTLEELLFKKFDGQRRPANDKPAAPDYTRMTAPPFIDTDDPTEAQRLRELLAKRFSMEAIKAAAKPPETPKPASEPVAPVETVAQEAPPQPPPVAKEAEIKPAETKAEVQPPPVAQPAPEDTKAVEAPAAQAVSAAPKPVETPPATQKEPADPVLRAAKIAAIVFAALFLLIAWTSYRNSGKYFIVSQRGAVEIWKGNFSPTGKHFFAVLHGYQLAEPIQETYGRKDIFPIIFSYYLNKADALLEVSGLPDYQAISDYLDKAGQFALSSEMQAEIEHRTNNIQRMTLYYKAEVDASKGTIESLESSLANLSKVQRLTSDPVQLEVVNQKIAAATAALEAAKIRQAEEAATEEIEQTPEETTKQ